MRPETELIVDLVDDVKENEELKKGLWAALGTGSGALAIGIARILGSDGRVIATDLSSAATAVASYNVRRVEKRSFQYIVGCEHWRDLVLSVEEGVLIPRPETELIVDLVHDVVKENEGLREGLWRDLGTGSGALAIGIARILGSEGRVNATDLSPVAAAVASYNVQRRGSRPKTEMIADLVDDVVKENEELKEGLWADLGTGSGALAIGIARILGSDGRVIATDLSPVATAVASYNVPETELIVDLVGDVVKENEELKEGLWADLGTGSGALAIGIARILGSNGRVIATDLSPVATAVASYNVQREGLWGDLGTGSGALAIGIARILGSKGRVIATDLSPVATAVASYNVQRYDLEGDLGTGSGALAIGIARILGSDGRVIATDLSPVATAVASYNVQRYDLEEKVHVKQGSWFEPLRDDEGEFVGLVSNPPYIPSKDIGGLQAEVGRHEPRLALDGGESGMNDLIHLCDGAVSMLKPGGFFTFETNGDEQSKFLVHYYIETKKQGNFSKVKMVSDFAGIKRFITGFRGRWSVTLAKEIIRWNRCRRARGEGVQILFSWV
ncbi:hypothetical protein K7X08_012381 [Anisodus acutangulus]|uniref:Peptide chain release factor N(5)-glutamine methyltransferase n=1 Tax=Anisodus acutangulus TaxID=402998 RepID=A0A9Q1LCS2_9SOLA|nr:hypothetical protein K7X08_012381 [Anisodus acutangulus]